MYSYIIRYELFYCYMFILLLLAVMAVEAKTSAVILSLDFNGDLMYDSIGKMLNIHGADVCRRWNGCTCARVGQ